MAAKAPVGPLMKRALVKLENVDTSKLTLSGRINKKKEIQVYPGYEIADGSIHPVSFQIGRMRLPGESEDTMPVLLGSVRGAPLQANEAPPKYDAARLYMTCPDGPILDGMQRLEEWLQGPAKARLAEICEELNYGDELRIKPHAFCTPPDKEKHPDGSHTMSHKFVEDVNDYNRIPTQWCQVETMGGKSSIQPAVLQSAIRGTQVVVITDFTLVSNNNPAGVWMPSMRASTVTIVPRPKYDPSPMMPDLLGMQEAESDDAPAADAPSDDTKPVGGSKRPREVEDDGAAAPAAVRRAMEGEPAQQPVPLPTADELGLQLPDILGTLE